MLYQIDENVWIETNEIQEILPDLRYEYPNGAVLSCSDSKAHGGEPKGIIYTRLVFRNKTERFIPCHPQLFVEGLKNAGVPFVENVYTCEV